MQYKVIPKNRFENVIIHLREFFFADEPLNKAVGLCARGAGHKDVEKKCLESLAENLSIMGVNNNDEIAGVELNGVLHPGDVKQIKTDIKKIHDPKFQKIVALLYAHHLPTNIFKKFHVDKLFELRILSVDSKYRGEGIGKELLKRSVSIASENKFKVVKADCTGIYSQQILKSFGFEVLSEIYYDKYVDEFGKPILPVEPPHKKLQLLYKILN